MRRSLNDIAEQLARWPDRADAVFHGQAVVPLLALLEHPYSEVSQHFTQALRQAGFSDAQLQKRSFVALVCAVLANATPYWIEHALEWIEQGFPITDAVRDALGGVQQADRLPQHTRHRAQRLLDRHVNEQYDTWIQELADMARQATHAQHRPSQILERIRDGWKAKTTARLSPVVFVRCVKTAFDIPLRHARDVEAWNGLAGQGRMSDAEVDAVLQPWIDAYCKRGA